MEMLSAFTAVLHVPYLSTSEQLVAVLEEQDAFSKSEILTIRKRTENRRYFNCLL